MKNTFVFLTLFVLILSGCNPRIEKPKAELLGKSQSQVLAKKGKPNNTEEFKLGDGMNEFRVELQNFYPLTDEKNKKIKIRELTWDKNGQKVTIWFHNVHGTWRALEKYEWQQGMEF